MSGTTKLKLLLIICCLWSRAAGQGVARQIFVDLNATGSNNGSSWANACHYLQDALAAAASGDEVLVAQGVYKPDQGKTAAPGNRAATFQLLDGVIIKGGYAGAGEADPNARDIAAHETILSGDLNDDDDPNFANHQENSYHVVTGSGTGEAAVLDGFTITSGGMYNESGSPTLAHCTFRGNRAWSGGTMRNYDSNPTLTHCTFAHNSADQAGGAIYNFRSSPRLTDCTFSENQASNGGAMYNHADSSPILTGCTFDKNSASYSGAMANYLNSNPILTNCKFSENSAEYGGAMRNYKSNPTLVQCAFSSNTASGDGGAMNNNSSSPSLTTCVFSRNSTQGSGGGIRNFESSPTLIGCTVCSNSAELSGGGMSNRKHSNPTLANCIFWLNNDANGTNESAQVYLSESKPVVNYCCIQGWTGALAGLNNIGTDPQFVDAGAGDYHLLPTSPCVNAGDPNYAAPAEATDLDGEPRIINGRVDMGADEYDNRRLVPDEYTTIQLAVDAAFDGDVVIISPGTYKGTGNRNIDFGGKAITVRSTDPDDAKVVSATVIDCEKEGRGFYFHSGEGEDSVLAGLTITNGFETNGGGIYCINSNPTLVRCVLEGNWAKYAGGGLCNSRGKPTLTDCVFADNWAYYGGGGMQNNSMGSATLRDCTFHKNWAKYGGGGMQNHDGSNPNLTNCMLSQNSANNRGGGMENYRSSPTLTDCTFSKNAAKSNGGGMYNLSGKPNLTNCTFSLNSANDNGGGMHNLYSGPILVGCVFSDNLSKNHGGGIFNGASNPVLTQCDFRSNWASNNGGGMYSRNGTVTLTNCIFSGNSADADGGAIGNSGDTTVANCTLSGNSARGQGGGIHNDESDSSLEAALAVTNCILWNNRDSGGVDESAQIFGGTPNVTYCCIQDADANDTNVYAGAGNIDDDPRFVRPGRWAKAQNPDIPAEPNETNAVWVDGDYHLLPASACIDAGDPDADFSAEPEPNGGRINMGAYGNTPEATSKGG